MRGNAMNPVAVSLRPLAATVMKAAFTAVGAGLSPRPRNGRARRPSPTLNAIILAALLLAALIPVSGQQVDHRLRDGGLTLVPETFLRGYDPVTIFFPGAAGPSGGGPEDHPERLLTVTPDHPGEYRWLDERTLIFRPAVPWPPLERYRWTVRGKDFSLVTLMVPPLRTLPADGAESLDPVEEVTLVFSEPVSPEKLAEMVSFELRALPGIGKGDPRWLTAEDYTVKSMERASITDEAGYVIRFKSPVGGGTRILLHMRLSLKDDASESFATYAFSTREPFRVLSAGCGQGDYGGGYEYEYEETYYEEESYGRSSSPAPGMLPVTLDGSTYSREQAVQGDAGNPTLKIVFSGDPAPLTLSSVRALIRFSPAIGDLEFTQSGPTLTLTGKIKRDTLYRALLQPAPLTDKDGRILEMRGPTEFHFYFPRQNPYLRWAQSRGIVERYGPQMVPLSGRGDRRVDLRIHKVDPLDLRFWPFPSSPVSLDDTARPPGPGEEPPPAEDLKGYVSAGQIATYIQTLGSPLVSRIVDLPLDPEEGSKSFGVRMEDLLGAVSGTGAPGTYLIGIRRLETPGNRDYARIQVTDLSLTTVEEVRAIEFLVTSLRTGEPVPGAEVRVEGIPHRTRVKTYQPLIQGTTDGRGLFRYEHTDKIQADIRRIVVRKGGDVLTLLPSDPPYSFADNHWHGPRGRWLGWLNSDPAVDPDESLLMAHLLTERPVYRPAEEVHIKGYLRERVKGHLKIPKGVPVELVVTDPGGKVRVYPVAMTEQGSFYHKFQESDLPTGTYTAALVHIKDRTTYGSVDWKMEAYKIPRFEAKIHGPEKAPMDREFTLTLTASYYAGGRVVDRPVLWRVIQFPHTYFPEGRKGFLFSSDERFSRTGRFESTGTQEKSDKTDESGASKISVNPALELDGRPRRYVFEATVTGADEQTVTATHQVLALPPFILGMKVDRFLKKSRIISPEIIAVDPENKLVAGRQVTVRLLMREWHSHLRETDFAEGKPKYVTDVVDEEIQKTTVTTADKPVILDLPVERAGIYVVEISARDRLGRLQVVTVDLFVAGDEPLSWQKPEAQVFETETDKQEYLPGETARILLKSPFQNARVLAVVEGPGGNEYHELAVQGGKAVFDLPIKNEYNPKVPVHFVLMRGRIQSRLRGDVGGGLDLGKPQTMASTRWVTVIPLDNAMVVELDHPEKALPGQEITMGIDLKTPGGDPLPGEVTLWLVDAAVLSLGREKRLDPLPSFVRERNSKLSIRDTRNRTIGEIATLEAPGGGGTEEAGDDILGKATVRKEFKTVPYYNARILVDASGHAEVTIKLSEDLTIFKVRAVACSGPNRFGAAKSAVAVRLPVIVQSALPRFARVGDRFTAGGIGRIVEGEGGSGSCQIQIEGAALEGENHRPITWVKDKPETLAFPMTVLPPEAGKPEQLTVRMGVKRDSDGAMDAFEVKIPVYLDRGPVVKESYQGLNPDRPVTLPALEEEARKGTIKRTVLITDQARLLKMTSALDYLFAYRHLCTEQRVSQSFPAVALRRLYDAYRIPGPREKTDEMVKYTLDYLAQTLGSNGLYSYWPGSDGSVSLTAYVVEFLTEAKKAGYSFDPELMNRPIQALKEALRSDYAYFLDGWAFTERSEALYALSKAGQFDISYGTELAKKSRYLDLFGVSRVLEAFHAGQAGEKRIQEALSKEINDGFIFKLRDGSEAFGGLEDRWKSWDGPVLSSEIKTQAAMIRALYPEMKGDLHLEMVVDDLVEKGGTDGWGNTQTNAQALLALKDVMLTPKPRAKRQPFRLTVGGSETMLEIGPGAPTAYFATGRAGDGKLTMVGGDAKENFSARLGLSYLPVSTGEWVKPRSEGFVVTLEFVRIQQGGAPAKRERIETEGKKYTFRMGEILEEHAQVINPEDRNYVAVTVPIAAGMEPMNPNLATSPKEARPDGSLTRAPTYAMYLDDEVRFYYENLPKGTYDFYFRVRAMTAGDFVQPAAHAERMYRPADRGNSPGARIVIVPRDSNEN